MNAESRFPLRSLNPHLTWVAAGVLPLLVFGIVMLLLFTRQQEQAIERLLREAADSSSLLVSRAVGEQIGMMEGMAASLAFDRGDLETVRAEAQRLWGKHPEWRTVIVTDDYRPLINIRFDRGESLPPLRDPESLGQVWSNGRPTVGNLVNEAVAFRVPVFTGGRIAYTIAVPVAPGFFRGILVKQGANQPWSAAVIGSDGIVIAATPASLLKEGQPSTIRLETEAGGFIASGTDYLAWAPVRGTGWMAVIVAPMPIVEQPFARSRTAVLAGGAAAAALTVFLVIFLSSAWAARRETARLKAEIGERIRTEQALRDSEEKFRHFAENAYEGIWALDADQTVTFSNDRMAQILGYPAGGVTGRPAIDFIHPADLEDHRSKLAERRRGERSAYERRMRHASGAIVWVRVSAVPVFDAQGRFCGSFGMFTDITERKAAEAALRESEERYRRVVDIVPDAISIFVAERFVFANRSGLTMVGAPDFEALRGRSIWDVCHPSCVALGRQRFHDCLREGRPLPPTEFELTGLDGRSVFVESSAVPIRFEGSPALLAVWRDITARKAAESALRENEELFRGTFDHSPVGQAMSDLEYRYLRCNDAFCRFLGYAEHELVGRSLFEFTHPEDRNVRSVSRDLITGETARARFQKRYVCKDGRVVWGEVTVRLVLGSDGTPRHLLSVVQDITAKVRDAEHKEKLEAQLRQAQKMEALGTLAGGIAHDFNNILGVIIGGAEMLELTEAAEASSRDTLANVLGAAHRAKDLVKQILAFSRHTRQERILLNLKSIVKETADFMRASLPATIQLRHYIEPASGAVVADPTQMQQVLMNLCTNAAHAMEKEGGFLEIRVETVALDAAGVRFDPELKPGRYVQLTVSDTGHGIDPAVVQRIFDPYFTTKEKGKGTGLGLAVVHGIVKAHSGAITVASAPGRGATFRVLLPSADSREEVEPRLPEPLPTGTGTILLVDDEAALLDTEARILTLLGYRVEAVSDPLAAVARFEAAPRAYDLVLTDMTMPQMSGLTMATRVMQIRPGVPVIVCTGFSDRITPESARAAGVAALLTKPLLARELGQAVRAALAA